MSFAPDIIEMLARARADLRMGVPVVLTGANPVLILAVETLTPQRLAMIQTLGSKPVLVITSHRATTLKAPAYDGDLARIALPKTVDTAWITAIANPVDDLRAPMKGPLQCQRDGDATTARAARPLIWRRSKRAPTRRLLRQCTSKGPRKTVRLAMVTTVKEEEDEE